MTEEKGLLGSTDAEALMKILTAVGYKDGMIYARQIAGDSQDIFLWDAVWKGQLYSSYIVITHNPGEELSTDVVDNARDMCYAGAAATIDFQRGEGLSDQEKKQVELFEENRLRVEEMDKEAEKTE